MVVLFPHQQAELDATEGLTHVAYYHTMGAGKTFTGAEKMHRLGAITNIVICQKSKIEDWICHISENYGYAVFDLTNVKGLDAFLSSDRERVGVINYELAFRRPKLAGLKDFTLMLDESSLIQNETAKRSKFILYKLKPKNVVLLSGTPTGGRYEKLWSQMRLLGWDISKTLYWSQYVDFEIIDSQGFPIKIVKGYKNVERLKAKMREHGCRFLTLEDVLDLPEQVFETVRVDCVKQYAKFRKDGIVTVDGEELVGDTVLKKMLYERMLCGRFNPSKIEALNDVLESTEERLIVFYNFNDELKAIQHLCEKNGKPLAVVNGSVKDLTAYENHGDSVTAIQYQAGSMGLNLQKANRIVYFTPPLSSELFEQSKKRIHRIGQGSACFYYMLTCKNSIEEKIYKTLEMRKDYTNELYIDDNADL